MIIQTDIENWFSYHAPDAGQIRKIQNIRDAAKIFATAILENTETGADQSAAIRKLRECVMTANASVIIPTDVKRAAEILGKNPQI